MITDTAGTHESSTCRSDPFVTDLHNAQYWLISYDLFANCATFYHYTRINERLQRDSLDGAETDIYLNKGLLRFFVLLERKWIIERIKLLSVSGLVSNKHQLFLTYMHSFDSSAWLNFTTIVRALNSQDFPLFNVRTSIGANIKMINNRFFIVFRNR